jgi:alanine racemase
MSYAASAAIDWENITSIINGLADNLIPAMTIKTKILCIRNLPTGCPISYARTYLTKRKSTIGVLPLGYADGYNRLFSNTGVVLVRGKRAPVVGRVCMDLTMVDLTEIKDVREGDEVVLLGRQGDETITAYENHPFFKCKSAKSRLTIPTFVINSAIPLTAPAKTSSETLNAVFKGRSGQL